MASTSVVRSKSCCSMSRKMSLTICSNPSNNTRNMSTCSITSYNSNISSRRNSNSIVGRKITTCSNISGCSDPCLNVRKIKGASRTSSNSSYINDASNNDRKFKEISRTTSNSSYTNDTSNANRNAKEISRTTSNSSYTNDASNTDRKAKEIRRTTSNSSYTNDTSNTDRKAKEIRRTTSNSSYTNDSSNAGKKMKEISRTTSNSSYTNDSSLPVRKTKDIRRTSSNCSYNKDCCKSIRKIRDASRTSSNCSYTNDSFLTVKNEVIRSNSNCSYNSYLRRKDNNIDQKISISSSNSNSSSNSSLVVLGSLEELVADVVQVGCGCSDGCGCGVYEGVVPGKGRVALHCYHKTSVIKNDLMRQPLVVLPDHPDLLAPSPGLYETDNSYVMLEEAASHGTLHQALIHYGGVLDEQLTKSVVGQVAAALQLLHLQHLVHRDLCCHTVQVSSSQLQQVRLSGLGRVHNAGERVVRAGIRPEWAAPEVSWAVEGEAYLVGPEQDTWALGIMIVICLTGRGPWAAANISDPHYRWWSAWATRTTTKPPPRFRCFTPRLLRLLRRLLHPKVELRAGVAEVNKYMDDVWLSTNKTQRPALEKRMAASVAPLLVRAQAVFTQLLAPSPITIDSNTRRVRFQEDNNQDDDARDTQQDPSVHHVFLAVSPAA